MAILDPITSLPQFRGGRIKIFAAMAKNRTATAPDIPTVDEAGASGVYVEPWQAMFAPKGTPKDVIAKLNGAVVSALDDPAIRKRFAEQSYVVTARENLTPEYLAKFHQAESRNGGRSSRRPASRRSEPELQRSANGSIC